MQRGSELLGARALAIYFPVFLLCLLLLFLLPGIIYQSGLGLDAAGQFTHLSRRVSSLDDPRSDIVIFLVTWLGLIKSASSSSTSSSPAAFFAFSSACFFLRALRSARDSSGFSSSSDSSSSSDASSSSSSDPSSESSSSSSASLFELDDARVDISPGGSLGGGPWWEAHRWLPKEDPSSFIDRCLLFSFQHFPL